MTFLTVLAIAGFVFMIACFCVIMEIMIQRDFGKQDGKPRQ